MPASLSCSARQNAALIRQLYHEFFTKWNFDVLGRFFAPTFTSNEIPKSLPRGPVGVRAFYLSLRSAFSDLRYIAEDVMAERDKVAVRWRWHAHHTGTFRGLEPTGRRVRLHGIAIYRIESGQAVKRWVSADTSELMRALGFEWRAPMSRES